MAYSPLSYAALIKATRSAKAQFFIEANLFTAPDYKVLKEKTFKLDENYKVACSQKKKPSWSLNLWNPAKPMAKDPDPTRLMQIALITQINNKLSADPLLADPYTAEQLKVFNTRELTEKELKKTKAQNIACMVLTGALVYRYVRIENSYKESVSQLIGQSPSNSELYNEIGKLLNLSQDNPLDALSIAIYCNAFRSYLYNETHYNKDATVTQFAYVQEDAEFSTKLNAIIQDAEEKSKILKEQVQLLDKMEEFTLTVQQDEKDFCEYLPKIKALLFANKPSNELFTAQSIGCILNAPGIPTRLQALTCQIWPDEEIKLNALNNHFEETLKSCFVFQFQCTLLGMSFMLRLKAGQSSALQMVFDKVLNLTTTSQPESKDMQNALLALQQYFSWPDLNGFNIESVWGDSKLFDKAIIRELNAHPPENIATATAAVM